MVALKCPDCPLPSPITHITWLKNRDFFKLKKSLFFNQVICVIGEGNGTPLQYSCLENPMDGGA